MQLARYPYHLLKWFGSDLGAFLLQTRQAPKTQTHLLYACTSCPKQENPDTSAFVFYARHATAAVEPPKPLTSDHELEIHEQLKRARHRLMGWGPGTPPGHASSPAARFHGALPSLCRACQCGSIHYQARSRNLFLGSLQDAEEEQLEK
jgi:hypothetical protein